MSTRSGPHTSRTQGVSAAFPRRNTRRPSGPRQQRTGARHDPGSCAQAARQRLAFEHAVEDLAARRRVRPRSTGLCWKVTNGRTSSGSWPRGWTRCSCRATRITGSQSCWQAHPQVVIELGNLWVAWLRAYRPKRPDIRLALEWHDRWMPNAARRIENITRDCVAMCKVRQAFLPATHQAGRRVSSLAAPRCVRVLTPTARPQRRPGNRDAGRVEELLDSPGVACHVPGVAGGKIRLGITRGVARLALPPFATLAPSCCHRQRARPCDLDHMEELWPISGQQ